MIACFFIARSLELGARLEVAGMLGDGGSRRARGLLPHDRVTDGMARKLKAAQIKSGAN